MTAEVAILNKQAVALAADSAVTIGDKKVYNSANKLFSLSKYHPVGIMIYGGAEFMGVPWEIIIKLYRQQLKSKSFDTLREYSKDFLHFLSMTKMFPSGAEEIYINEKIRSFFGYLKKMIEKQIEKNLPMTDEKTGTIVKEIIQATVDDFEKREFLSHVFPPKYRLDFIGKYVRRIDAIVLEIFEKIPLGDKEKHQLSDLIGYVFFKDYFPFSSGVVIAGYGDLEIFPQLLSFDVECRVDKNHIKYAHREEKSATINQTSTASLVPFAQSDMVATFMEGIDLQYLDFSTKYLESLFNHYSTLIVNGLNIKDESTRQGMLDKIRQDSKQLLNEYTEETKAYRRKEHINPIIEMVAALPKDELATMAEALVNLTSFKRRVTAGTETVGGPVDVAVISKGDGFVWITRKHYFRPELNQHFFANYFKESF